MATKSQRVIAHLLKLEQPILVTAGRMDTCPLQFTKYGQGFRGPFRLVATGCVSLLGPPQPHAPASNLPHTTRNSSHGVSCESHLGLGLPGMGMVFTVAFCVVVVAVFCF